MIRGLLLATTLSLLWLVGCATPPPPAPTVRPTTICMVTDDGAFERSEDTKDMACAEFLNSVQRAPGKIAWLCWITDPCFDEAEAAADLVEGEPGVAPHIKDD